MKVSFTCLLLLMTVIVFGQPITNVYQPDSSPIANPERGFYHHTEVHSGSYGNLNVDNLTEYREDEEITQILRVFYLENFSENLISQEYLNGMHLDFNIAREAGIKVIVRFAYGASLSAPYGDATPEIVKNHIFQLKEILNTHRDVISVIQTGFIGSWGEWYYTDHFAGANPWQVSDENWEDRSGVVEDLLRVLPDDRMVQLRTPGYKMRIFDTEEPLGVPEAFSRENISRVGHHNDCFVASSSDFGTYVNQELEKPYLEEETKYTPMGGETCALAPPYSDCENAYSELQRFHWSYLNIDYNNSVLNVWRDQGCFDDVELNLGYRFILDEATTESTIHPDGTFDLSLDLQNHGFANFYNPRDLSIFLKSTSSEQIYQLVTDEETGLWPLQEDFTIDILAGFPADVVSGTYEVYAALPDKSPSLRDNPAYSVRFANEDIWNDESGWNNLNLEVTINTSNTSDSYTGDAYFASYPAEEVVVPGPTELYFGTHDEAAILFWGRSTQHEYRRIDRSTDGTSFEPLIYLAAENDSYRPVANNSDYYYRYALIGENEDISYSNTVFLTATTDVEDVPVEINIDGNDQDWRDLSPTATLLSGDFESHILRTHFSLTKAHFALYGQVDNYEIYLNTDNSSATGSNETDLLTGMDYKLEDGSLFHYEGNAWVLTSTNTTSTSGSIHEVELPHNLFENIGNNYFIPIVALLNDDAILLSESEVLPAIHIRNLPPDVPANLDIKNSANYPEERLEVHWDLCLNCDGYILEKSDDGSDFYFLADVDYDDDIYYHDFLPQATHYYRIKSYNELGESDYSGVESGILSSINNITYGKEIKVWPNPTSKNRISTDATYQSLSVYNSSGLLVKTFDKTGRTIDISAFSTGVYLFVFEIDEQKFFKTVVKQ